MSLHFLHPAASFAVLSLGRQVQIASDPRLP